MNALRALVLLCGVLLPDLGHAQDASWDYLGRSQVDLAERRATIPIPAEAGYEAIRLHVIGAPVYVASIRVTYADGTTQTLPVRERVDEGGRTPDLRLARPIPLTSLGLVYRSDSGLRTGRATVRVYGDPAPAPPPEEADPPAHVTPAPILTRPIRIAPVVRLTPYTLPRRLF